MFVTHVNGHYVETYVNIKLPFFLHVPILLKKISLNIVGHGMDLIVEVLLPCLRTLPINEVKEGGVQFIDHTTSLLRVIATNVQTNSPFQGE
jgi:hypothetical protein